MCGIAGIFHLNKKVEEKEILSITNSLKHRGPDDYGIFIDNNIALGHRRLSILDLSSKGRNPFYKKFSDNTEYYIVYNGEIFNFIELRKEMISEGYHFETETDTEVILAVYHKYGNNALHKFNGMWAFAIYNPHDKTILLSRDRFGIKPLYFLIYNNSFYFASEIKAFLNIEDFSFEFDEETTKFALSNIVGYEGLSPKTLFKNIFKILPGYNLLINSKGNIKYDKWWHLENNLIDPPINYKDQVEIFRNLLIDATNIRMRSDVNIGSSLSGGTDSSTIASIVQLLSYEKIERKAPASHYVFAAKFPNSFLDESNYIDLISKEKNFDLKSLSFEQPTQKDILKSIFISENITVSSLLPIIKTYELMNQNNIKVTLDGHGADELLCGYTFYLAWPQNNFKEKLQFNFEYNILPAILRNFDLSSMANGIEVRMPFLDHRVVSFIFSLPITSIIGNGYTKRILRDAFSDIVPHKIIYRHSKIGFNSPTNNWLNTCLNDFAVQIFSNKFFNNNPFWDYNTLKDKFYEKTLLKKWENNTNDFLVANEFWSYINLTILYELFIEKKRDLYEQIN